MFVQIVVNALANELMVRIGRRFVPDFGPLMCRSPTTALEILPNGRCSTFGQTGHKDGESNFERLRTVFETFPRIPTGDARPLAPSTHLAAATSPDDRPLVALMERGDASQNGSLVVVVVVAAVVAAVVIVIENVMISKGSEGSEGAPTRGRHRSIQRIMVGCSYLMFVVVVVVVVVFMVSQQGLGQPQELYRTQNKHHAQDCFQSASRRYNVALPELTVLWWKRRSVSVLLGGW